MAKTTLSGAEFISSNFKPNILIITSTDAELLCIKNHLTFTDLLKPFSLINKDVLLRDQNNINHTIKNLHINFCDYNSTQLSQIELKKLLNTIVSKASVSEAGSSKFVKHGNSEISIPISTPWFEAWRSVFLENLIHSEHEFLNHYLACIFVVSTFNNDIADQFQRLNQQLTSFQSDNISKFFNNSILKYYVLLHDQGQGDKSKGEELHRKLQSTHGANNSFLLSINSASTTANSVNNTVYSGSTTAHNSNDNTMNSSEPKPDPWLQFLIPGGNLFVDSEFTENLTNHDAYEDSYNKPNHSQQPLNSYDDPLSLFSSTKQSPNADSTTLHHSKQQLHGNNVKNSTSYPMLHNASTNYKYNFLSHDNHVYNNESQDIPKFKSDIHKPHGQCLSTSDHERIREFVYEFVSFALIPWVEGTLKQLSEQIAYKMKMTRGLLNVTRKYLGLSSNSASRSSVSNSSLSSGSSATNLHPSSSTTNIGSTKVIYAPEAIEMQMRRHADLAFLFQQYELAHQTYSVLKKDFQDDAAWLHYAGVMEMSALSIFLQGSSSQRQYPIPFMDSAINIYASQNRNIDYATRAALLNCEALKTQGLYLQASNQFIKLTTEENDLRSALLLEQSAHFYVHTKTPMLRKYAFHLILAGYRYSKAGQKHHTIRCYTQALPIFKTKNWILAEDHIYATISKNAYSQNQLELALDALVHLLSKNSRQTQALQASHLRDYLKIHKELLEKKAPSNDLPEFPIPAYDPKSIKVMLGQPSKHFDDVSLEAKDIEFSDDKFQLQEWQKMEVTMLEKIQINQIKENNQRASIFRHQLEALRPSCLSKVTENKKPSNAIIGEPITIQVYVENPLHIPLVLTEVSLLWTFKFDKSQSGYNNGSGVTEISNEKLENCVDNSSPYKQEYVASETIHELCLLPKERKPIEIYVKPRYQGFLELKGLSFYLNSNSPTQSVNPSGTIVMPTINNTSNAISSSVTGNTAVNSVIFNNSGNYDSGNESDILELPILKLKGKLMFQIRNSLDKILQFNVVQSMPKLKVVFSEFPKSLAIDEVFKTTMTISNIGKEPMTNLHLSTKPYNNITLSSSLTSADTNTDSSSGYWSIKKHPKYTDSEYVHKIDLNNIQDGADVLLPGNSINVSLWIRCPHNRPNYASSGSSSKYESLPMKFLFYYESLNDNQNTSENNSKHKVPGRFRFLRHKSVIDIKHTQSARAHLVPCKGVSDCSYLVNFKFDNHTHPTEKKITDFQIQNISAISKSWCFSEKIDNLSNGTLKVSPRETHSIYLKLTQYPQRQSLKDSDDSPDGDRACLKQSLTEDQYFHSTNKYQDNSELSNNNTNSSLSSLSDFFHYDYFSRHANESESPKDDPYSDKNRKNEKSEQETAKENMFKLVQDEICFIILWKATVSYSKDFHTEHFGQSHIFSAFHLDSSINFRDQSLMKPSHTEQTLKSIASTPALLSSSHNSEELRHQFSTSDVTKLSQNNTKTDNQMMLNAAISSSSLQSFYHYSKLINICYDYQELIEHDFIKKKKLILTVNVILINTSNEQVMVRIEPIEPPESLSSTSLAETPDPLLSNEITSSTTNSTSQLSNNKSQVQYSRLLKQGHNQQPQNPNSHYSYQSHNPITKVTWLGVCSRQSIIRAHDKLNMKYKCLITRPGIYEIQSLQVRAATFPSSSSLTTSSSNNDSINQELTFIKQENSFSQILTVSNKFVGADDDSHVQEIDLVADSLLT